MKKIRIAALILAVFMLLCSFASCKENENENNNVSTTVSTEQGYNPMYDESGDGRDFIILTREVVEGDYLFAYAEAGATSEDMGSDVDQQVYLRDLHLNETFEINIVNSPVASGKISSTISTDNMAGTQIYDIAMPMVVQAFDLGSKGELYEFGRIPYVDITKDYWQKSIYDATSVGGYNFFCPSAANLSTYNTVGVTFFNKYLREELKIQDPYALVESGQWTIEAMKQMCLQATGDIDGLLGMTYTDRYGIAANDFVWQPFFHSSGYLLVEKDADDIPYLAATQEGIAEIVNNILGQIVTFLNDPTRSLLSEHVSNATYEAANLETDMFLKNRSLFWVENVYGQYNLRNMERDYGILPMPKWNAEAEYVSYSHCGHSSVMAVPLGAADVALSGAVMEEMAMKSKETLIPEFYEETVRIRGSRDEQSYEILDNIYENVLIDLALVMNNAGLKADTAVRNMVVSNNANFAGMFGSLGTGYETILENAAIKFAQKAADQYAE